MIKDITVDELKEQIDNNEDFLLVDTRTEEEYEENHLKNSVLIPHFEINDRHNELSADKNKKIILYCRTGARSKIAAEILENLGYNNIENVLGGITAWIEKRYEVE